MLACNAGCTRWWYRKQVDCDVEAVLREKDLFPEWKIEEMPKGAYPNPLARFGDPSNPDRPTMPPDDPAAQLVAPNPQKPCRAGVGRMEGTGYLDLLAMWDSENRQKWAAEGGRESALSMAETVRAVALWQKDGKPELIPAPKPVDALPKIKTNPYLLRVDQAMELGLINSREFQTRREDLYLAALPVTRERFAFSAQFFAIEQAIRERTGENFASGKGDRWNLNSTTGISKFFSTGALLLLGFANQTVIELTNPANNHLTSISRIDLDFLQPLLRGGGRAVALEPLTQAERNLLYDIRSYARFRKQYYQYLIGGENLPSIGATSAGNLTASHPAPSLGAGNPARAQISPGASGTLLLGVNASAPSEGFLPSVLKAAQLENEVANVNALRGLLKLFDAYESGGQISALQVGQVKLQFLDSQTRVLASEQNLRDSLDNFKMQLGIPVHLPLELDRHPIQPITDHLTRYDAVIKDFEAATIEVDKLDSIDKADKVRAALASLLKESKLAKKTAKFKVAIPERWERWAKLADAKAIQDQLEKLTAERRKLYDKKSELQNTEQNLSAKELDRLATLESEIALANLELVMRRYEKAPWAKLPTERARRDEQATRWRDVRNAYILILVEASNERFALLRPQWAPPPAIVIEGVDLINTDVETAYEVVARTALENRLDLMNTRAQVVDAWRQVRVFANNLLGTFAVAYHMDSSTPPGSANPLAFQSTRTRHQLGLNFELPIVRLTERNAYRASQIAYQRARRDLDQHEDEIVNQVRSEIRQLQVLAKNLKIQQQAVELAYQQVESSLETFRAPAAPNEGGNAAANAFSLTQQLLQAYNRLPAAQNFLLKTWIDYHVLRQQLFLDLELMPLDARGVWIDELSNLAPPGTLPVLPERPSGQVPQTGDLRAAVRFAP
jgi:hypothetical protein